MQEVIENSIAFGFGWTQFEQVQDAWASAAAEGQEACTEVGAKIIRLFTEGYFANRPESLRPDWKYVLEEHLMEVHGLDYLESKIDNRMDGCLARQANRARTDVFRRVVRK